MSNRWLTIFCAVLVAGGAVMLGLYGRYVYVAGSGHRAGVEAFEAARASHTTATQAASVLPPVERPDPESSSPEPDTRDWSEARAAAYESLRRDGPSSDIPEGLLRIPSVSLVVPVYSGTGDAALTRGAGRIEGTPPVGAPGNTGIAAHRDGWFRVLKDVQAGDRVEVETLDGAASYRVTGSLVVEPGDVHVLAPTERDSLTLVTCYPFYFVGPAPQRYIVRAEREADAGKFR